MTRVPDVITNGDMSTSRPPEIAAHERLYRALRSQIMLGELPPGKALTLRGLAAERNRLRTCRRISP